MATPTRQEGAARSNASLQPRVEDVNTYVKDMLLEMETEFNEVGDSILGRMNEMGKRMDDLENSISDLMNQAGLEGPGNSSGEASSLAEPKGSPSNASQNSSNSAVL
mmetsp:Transcript_124060/g.185420  ORF Transcript_124060/g.185420 Transcript_124060/m.185420 type:complete len:107 (-) Transcript_124060:159-479(-)